MRATASVLVAVAAVLALLCGSLAPFASGPAASLLLRAEAATVVPPTLPVAPFGVQPSSRYWANYGTVLSAGTNPLNGAQTGTSGAACTATSSNVQSVYYFSVKENYQQQVTFAPISACSNLIVQLTSVPASRGVVYRWSATNGRGFPITASMLPYNLTASHAIMYQPALNDFSVYDDQSLGLPLVPPRNGSMGSPLGFKVFDLNTPAVPPVQSTVQFWVLWQNQAPLTPPMQIDLSTHTVGYENKVLNLSVTDADMSAGITQFVSAYIDTLPNGTDCVGAQLYQYDENAPLFRGAPITMPQTPVEDGWPSFRVVMEIGGTGRPYCTFNYTADDYLVETASPGQVTVNILVEETPVSLPLNVTLDQIGAGTTPSTDYRFQLPVELSNSSTLNRAIITSMPTRGSVYQVLPDGKRGQRVQVVPTEVTDPARFVWFLPDPFSTSNGDLYTTFDFLIDNGLLRSNSSTVSVYVNSVHLPPSAGSVPVTSPTGADVAVSFRASSPQPGTQTLTVLIASYPVQGTLKQNDAVGTPINNVTCPLPCNVTSIPPEVNYSPAQNPLDPSQNKRYSESFTYIVYDQVLYSTPGVVSVQVGSRIRPPLVYDSVYYTTQDVAQILIQLNGTAQDGDTWGALITRLPSEGTLYQMTNAQRGAPIELAPNGAAAVVTDLNFYVYYVPNRFSGPVVDFEFEGLNSDSMHSQTKATVTINVAPVGYAPRVTTQSVSTPASQPVNVQLTYSAGPSPPPTDVYITELPENSGAFYQFNSTSNTIGPLITSAQVAAGKAASLPGVLVTDPNGWIQYVPPPYVHGPAALAYAFTKFDYTARSLTIDGLLTSPAAATVNLAVTQVNFPPSVSDAWVTVPQGTTAGITLTLGGYVFNPSDTIAGDGATNSYRCKIATLPPKGILYQVDASGRASTQILAPDAERDSYVADAPALPGQPGCRVIYKAKSDKTFGSPYDSFRFFAVDPVHISEDIPAQATMQINVTFVNKAPDAVSASAYMYENQAKVIQLKCDDSEGSNCSTTAKGAMYITSVNLPRGQLFQYVESGGSVPADIQVTKGPLALGGLYNDPEWWRLTGNTPENYTGLYGGGFDRTPNVGAPITSWPVKVTDPKNRVLFAPLEYDHGYIVSSEDWIYGNPFMPGQGTFNFIANDGELNSTTPGKVSVRVVAVPYDPEAYDRTFTVAEDGFVVIPLPVRSFDAAERPLCYIMDLPGRGSLWQYDARKPLDPRAEQILSLQTHVQDFKSDGTPGDGCTVVYYPPKLNHGANFTTFTFRAETSATHRSDIATINIDVSKTNHAPSVRNFSIVLAGHNDTVPVVFNVTELDYQPVYINITAFPDKGGLWTAGSFNYDPSPSGFHTWTPVAGTQLLPATRLYYPPAPIINASNPSTSQLFSVLFDTLNMGGRAVPTGCLVNGGESGMVACGYSSFSFRLYDAEGMPSPYDNFVQIIVQCGPAYVVNTWQSIGGACVMCPTGAICPIEGQFTPLAIAGYWRGITPTGLMFVQCDPPSACLGTWNQSALVSDLDMQCANGYHGRICAACDDRYYKLNNECKPCPATSVFWVVLGGVPVIVLLMYVTLHVSRRGIDLTFFAIVLTYLQILAVYSQYHLTWPTEVMTVLTVFSITHLNLDIFAVSCYYNTGDYSDKWKAKMAVVPGLALGVVAMIGTLIVMRRMCGRVMDKIDFVGKRAVERDEDGNPIDSETRAQAAAVAALAAAEAASAKAAQERPSANRKASSGPSNYERLQRDVHLKEDVAAQLDTRAFLNNDPSAGFGPSTPMQVWMRYYVSLGFRTFTLLMFIAYLPICVKAFQIFNCTAFPDGTSTFDADPSLICYDTWWNELRPWGVLAVLVYGLGIPLWFLYALKKTHPPFEWVQYWKFIWYPRVKTGLDGLIAKAKLVEGQQQKQAQSGRRADDTAAANTDGSSNNSGSGAAAAAASKLPPPPPNPPSIPAPAVGSTAASSFGALSSDEADTARPVRLHDATVEALKQAAVTAESGDERRQLAKEQAEEAQALRMQAAWAKSENLALTSATSTTLNQNEKITRFMFTLAIDPFRDDLFFWMLVVLFRSFLLAMVSIFFADEPVYQATLALLVLFLYTLATAYFKPYVNPSMNKLEFLLMSCACLVLFCGFLFVGEPSKGAAIFHVLSALCLLLILVSLVAVGRVVFLKLEELFHCWNCRKVPAVEAPSMQAINRIGHTLHKEIQTGHQQATSKTGNNPVQSIVQAGVAHTKPDDGAASDAAKSSSGHEVAAAAAATAAPEEAAATHFKISAPAEADASERKQ